MYISALLMIDFVYPVLPVWWLHPLWWGRLTGLRHTGQKRCLRIGKYHHTNIATYFYEHTCILYMYMYMCIARTACEDEEETAVDLIGIKSVVWQIFVLKFFIVTSLHYFNACMFHFVAAMDMYMYMYMHNNYTNLILLVRWKFALHEI